MKIYYGIKDNCIDVTNICLSLAKNNCITIPTNDINRAALFTDPLPGILKKIIIENIEYDVDTQIKINVTHTITTINNHDIDNKLKQIHSTLTIHHGRLEDELPEQKMAVRYLTGNEKVLEIGGNIGRNSLVIASILKENSLVTLETDTTIASQLTENKELNHLSFYIENAALSNRKLIQKGWETIPSDTLLEGYFEVNTITFNELKTKYNIEFDTLVLDCEGAFYYILMDMPELLNNIKLIIMENDYHDITHKNYIDEVLKQNQFSVDYSEGGGWGPCHSNFFEVWKKNS